MRLASLLAFVLTAPLFAQIQIPTSATPQVYNNGNFRGTFTVANLPPAASNSTALSGVLVFGAHPGDWAFVSDGNSSTPCTVGGGTTGATCQFNGTTWVTVGGGGGGTTYPSGTGIAVVTGGATWGTTLTAPTGALVGAGQANTFTTGLQDFSGATWKIPTGAGFTSTANSMFGYDSTAGFPHIWWSASDKTFGSASFVNTGTSGGTVCLANANCTLSGTNSVTGSAAPSGSGTITSSTDNYSAPTALSASCGGTTTWTVGNGLPNTATVTFPVTNPCATTLAISGTSNGPLILQSIQNASGTGSYTSFPGTFTGGTQPAAGNAFETDQVFTWNGTSFSGGNATCPNCTWRGLISVEGTVPTPPSGSQAFSPSSTDHYWHSSAGIVQPLYLSTTNCASAASPAVCAAAPAGAAVIAASATTVVVDTSAVTANSDIQITRNDALGTRLSVTCDTQSSLVLGTPRVTAISAGVSFTVAIDVGPTTNPMCFTYTVVN